MPRKEEHNLETTQHYYTARPEVLHDPGMIQYEFAGRVLRFHTDAGVFSKHRVDYGSDLLNHSVPPLSGAVLDMGCGYGAMGLSLAVANPQARFTLVDINERAIDLTSKNMRENHLSNVTIKQGDGFSAVSGQTFDAIVTNPPIRAGKTVTYKMYDDAYAALQPGGSLFVVIQKKQGAPSTKEHLTKLFGTCEVIARGAGYWILQAVKKQ